MSSRVKSSKTPQKGRSRKYPIVDTNLESYDRKDPFHAFKIVVSLLSSLATRVGGCQYKLTPEEHTLSIYLIGIVEPYVGAHPSRRTLITRQPTEILDAIVFHIDSKQDLLSLALSCQRMHSIVIPRHFDYRSLRCKVSSIRVWNHLIVNRSLAKNVRKLEIMDERSAGLTEQVPLNILASDTDLESTDDELGLHTKQERYLVAALTKMTGLSSFVWSCNHSPISIDNIWPTLLKCRSLNEVHIKDNIVFSPEEESCTVRALVLPTVKIASFQSTKFKYGASQTPCLDRVKGLLNHCPNLESLNISYTRPQPQFPAQIPAGDILFSRWQNLNSLVLTNLRCAPGGGLDAAASFLHAHVNLETLHLDITGMTSSTRLILPVNTLPRLRELKASRDITTDILQSPTDVPRPLEVIKGVKLSGSQQVGDQMFLANLKLFAPELRRLELSGWHEMEDIRRVVESAPSLVWLDTGRKLTGAPGTVNNTIEWANLLSALPDLTTFHGVKFFYEASQVATGHADRSRMRRNEEVASLLAWKCAKLRRLDHWEDLSSKVIILSREKDGVKWDTRRVKGVHQVAH